MIKSYVLEGEQYKLVHRTGEVTYLPYRKDIEKIIALQNQVEYLEQELDEDKTFLNNYRRKEENVKSDVLKCGVSASLATVALSLTVYSLSGNLSKVLIATSAYGGVVLSSTIFTYLKHSYRRDISSFDEVVNYLLKVIPEKKNELSSLLENNDVCLDNLIAPDSEEKTIDINGSLKPLRDSVSLRYQYARNKRKFFKYLEKGILSVVLNVYGYSSEAVADFMIYIESEYTKKLENSKIQKMKKIVKAFI